MSRTTPPTRNSLIKFDVMLNGRYVDTIRLAKEKLLCLSPNEKVGVLKEAVERRRPTIRNKPYEIFVDIQYNEIRQWI